MKFTEEEKDLLVALADSPYYAVIGKCLEMVVRDHELEVLKQTDKEELWDAKMQLKGALKAQKDIIMTLSEARQSLRRSK